MPTLARVGLIPFRHERQHAPLQLRHRLRKCFKCRSLIRSRQCRIHAQRHLNSPRSAFLMKAFKRHAHVFTHINQTPVKIRIDRVAQRRITTVAAPQRLDRTVIFCQQGLAVFIRRQKLILKSSHRKQAHVLRPLQHPTQHAARANAFQAPHQLTLHPEHVVFQRNLARGFR